MASNPPGKCCTVGAKHQGEPIGTHASIDNGSLDVYIAKPTTPKAGKAVLFVPDVMGISQNANLMADQLAANGYYTLIPDLFNKDSLSNPWRPENFNLMNWIQHGMKGDNPHTVPEVDAIMVKALDYLNEQGYKEIAAVGYCFGAKYVVRFMSEEKGKRIKVGYLAHPSFVDEAELEAVEGPVSISAAETDTIFPVEERHKSEEILAKIKVPYQINLFSGVSHGFAVRGDLNIPQEKWSKEQAFEQAVQWFNFHL
ncbi:hypothetical protein VC83_05086 [Pseudogymnoascus destructans]|uniref:Dienelactone hydrolase domain-containing protein n=2 Tax=Pseudogymnoascus destructans TaxID=655981 RepID=L8FVN8_PSED2|nr:uncharacterized protein VC83_05086 [Pseudogymnoascus destructans]ELR05030.1 hypothetical protein GMDG_01601 [Pseudogymnoascus destructans 20631-21]OAF58705.2 hypothetical protein VC83_05086 [Pseudogymnoascus destructans]